ncbi:MAG: type II toxin-antitoxin system death-on-curing family toxin [Planctomycetota bacterium]
MKDDPIWIERSVADALHEQQLELHGGSSGVRDAGLLDSALNRPRQLFAYSDPTPDIPTLAACYAFAIARNHAFVDGNKRTAAVVCELFLNRNGYELVADNDAAFDKFLALAAGDISEEAFTDWLSANVRKLSFE